MEPSPQKIFSVVRPSLAKGFPYLAWGYGKTPASKDQTIPILAIAWGGVIQLVSAVNTVVKTDGYYYSNSKKNEIIAISFIGDGLLMIIQNKKVRVLYASEFRPGSYYTEEQVS
jgi:hypothetical protein